MPSEADIYKILSDLAREIEQIKTTQDRVLVPQSNASIKRWQEYDKLNIIRQFENVDKLNKKADSTHQKIDALDDRIEQLTVRTVCVEENDKIIHSKINERLDVVDKQFKQVHQKFRVFQWSFGGVAAVFLLIYTKIIFIDHENLAKILAIFFA